MRIFEKQTLYTCFSRWNAVIDNFKIAVSLGHPWLIRTDRTTLEKLESKKEPAISFYLFNPLGYDRLKSGKKLNARPGRNAYYLESVCRSVTKTKLQLENCGK